MDDQQSSPVVVPTVEEYTGPRYYLGDLSGEEHLVLNWAYFLYRPKDVRSVEFMVGFHRYAKSVPAATVRAAKAKGIKLLLEKGIIEAERDGEGDWVPTVINEHMLQRSGGVNRSLITGRGQ